MAIRSLNSSKAPAQVRIVEVGPRDGLQNEPVTLPTATKLRLIELLTAAKLPEIEVTSFVSPRWIPALADSEAVAAGLPAVADTVFSALVPNAKGYERAKAAGVQAINIFLSASDAHSLKNVNRPVAEHLALLQEVISQARRDGLPVRAYLSMVFGCPYEGDIAPEKVGDLVDRLLRAGCREVSLGDTVGLAQPAQVSRLVAMLAAEWPLAQLALHFHDTRGLALANAYAGWQAGISCFDGAVGGLGGCPYATGASGNVATEELVYLFHSLGVETGVDLDRLCEAATYAADAVGRALPSRFLRAWQASRH